MNLEMNDLINMKDRKVIWIVMLFLFLIACNNGQEEKGKNFQVRYDPENKELVRDSMEALIEYQKKMYEKTDSIEFYLIYWLKIKEIDTGFAKEQIKTTRSVTKYLKENDIPGIYNEKTKDAILKAFEIHDDSLVNFYNNFHGFEVKYNTYLRFSESAKIKTYNSCVKLWVDTNGNIIHETYTDVIPMVIAGDSVYSPRYTSKMFVREWWPDTLTKHIDTVFWSKEIRENAKFVE